MTEHLEWVSTVAGVCAFRDTGYRSPLSNLCTSRGSIAEKTRVDAEGEPHSEAKFSASIAEHTGFVPLPLRRQVYEASVAGHIWWPLLLICL